MLEFKRAGAAIDVQRVRARVGSLALYPPRLLIRALLASQVINDAPWLEPRKKEKGGQRMTSSGGATPPLASIEWQCKRRRIRRDVVGHASNQSSGGSMGYPPTPEKRVNSDSLPPGSVLTQMIQKAMYAKVV